MLQYICKTIGIMESVMKKTYNKLVRDHIPTIIENDNKKCNTRILEDKEYIDELLKKLKEESNELCEATDKDSIISEIADVMEVLDAIQNYHGIDFSQVLARKVNKAKTRGRFNDRIFLEDVEE